MKRLYCTNDNVIYDEKIVARYSSDSDSGGLLSTGYKKNSDDVLSIITVSLNCLKDLEKTMNSVFAQKYKNIEYIVVDGDSNDGTKELLKEYESYINFWISEKDTGIYNAMNKALKYINGSCHLFLNAGDVIVGDLFDKSIKSPSYLPVFYKNFWGKFKQIKSGNYKLRLPNNHQGIIFESKGIKYSEKYSISDDYQYYLDHGYRKLKFAKTNGFIYFDNNGINKKFIGKRNWEVSEIIRKNFGPIYYFIFISIEFIKKMIRKVFG